MSSQREKAWDYYSGMSFKELKNVASGTDLVNYENLDELNLKLLLISYAIDETPEKYLPKKDIWDDDYEGEEPTYDDNVKFLHDVYKDTSVKKLREYAKDFGLVNYQKLKKRDLKILLIQHELGDTPPNFLPNQKPKARKTRKPAKWKLENEAIAQRALNRVNKSTQPKKTRNIILKAVKEEKARVCGKYKNLNKKSKADLMRLL